MPTLLSLEALESDRMFVSRQCAGLTEASDPWGTARLMWQSRLAEIDERIAALSVQRSNYASVALVFNGAPVVGSEDIRLDFTTDVLDSYQRVVSSVVATRVSDTAVSRRGRLPGADRSRLYIRSLVRGSMGFILEELVPDQQDMLPTPLKGAVEDTTRLIGSLSEADDGAFATLLETTPPRTIGAVQKFAKVLRDAGASARLLGDESKLDLNAEKVGTLTSRLSEVVTEENREEIEGVFNGILSDSRLFEMAPSDVIKGVTTEDLAERWSSDEQFRMDTLFKRIKARVVRYRTIRQGHVVREQLLLEAVEPVVEASETGSEGEG